MFSRVTDAQFLAGEHACLRFWNEAHIFDRLREKNAAAPPWSFLDGPITANNPMGVHHAWGRTYKDAYQRFFAMTGRRLRYQNGFDCQGLWVEVEVEKELNLGTKTAILEYGIDRFVNECKKRVLRFAARQTEQSQRLGYWMDWDDPDTLRKLADKLGTDKELTITVPSGQQETGVAHRLVEQLGNPEWGGSYFTFSTENNETIWTFLKKCYDRGKIYRGHDVMPWGGRAGSAYSQMEIADGRKLTTHESVFVRFPLLDRDDEYLLVWTTTPWTLTSNVAAAVNPDLDYVKLQAKRDGAIYYFAKENLESKRLEREFKEGFGRPEWQWPEGVGKLKSIAQIFKENRGYEIDPYIPTIKGAEMIGWRYRGPFDDLEAPQERGIRISKAGRARIGTWAEPDVRPEGRRSNYSFATVALLQEFDRFDDLDNPERDAWSEFKRKTATLADLDGEHAAEIYAEDQEALYKTLKGLALQKCAEFRGAVQKLLKQARRDGVFGAEVPTAHRLGEYSTLLQHLDLGCQETEAWEIACGFDDVVRQMSEAVAPFDRWESTIHERVGGLRQLDLIANHLHYGDLVLEEGFLARIHATQSKVHGDLFQGLQRIASRSAREAHRVIDGGRDSRGNPHVVAGEGTGIVHIAPGCGDVDHTIGEQLGLPGIAPLKEDGTFDAGFGPFTGREAIDPETAQLVFDQLREQNLLVATETYPHVYPHCWRTGEELVFRLVDEWFVNMDWRDEIKEVTRAIEWLPDSIDGEERELEWLSNMRDWMISKKRVWGLALPFWINPDDPTDFEVIGSLAELKERAVEGWEVLEANTPHRPWIDAVKIKSRKTGATLERIPDVGNPWLDAGIVPFSTLNYNERYSTETLNWADWYPADLVTECFPGQFRNWFYSMLSLGTMMLSPGERDEHVDEKYTTDPAFKRPFETLLGHRLVMDELGRPMHKSDGTAIWFEEAAEQLGVDTLRWMYLAHNPAQDLRFGLRHPDEPVAIETPDGPISETREGQPTCKVTSTPADEIRRQILIPLWNSYKFLVNFAVLDDFDPSAEPVPTSERSQGDQWLLSNLQAFLQVANDRFAAFDAPAVCAAAAHFLDDLSNWYIRRNKSRFWSKRGEGDERDKRSAYQTLHSVLLTFSQAIAPIVPFLAERMYRNLALGIDDLANASPQPSTLDSPPPSVHLCDYPQPDAALLDPDLNAAVEDAQRFVGLVHRLRDDAGHRVRLPLSEVRYATTDVVAGHVEGLADVLREELNVKALVRVDSLDAYARYTAKPNLKTLGPKYGKLLGVLRNELPNVDPAILAPLRAGESVALDLAGNSIELLPDDVLFETETTSGWAAGDDGDLRAALNLELTPALLREGMARDFVRHVQQQRGAADLEENARIVVHYTTDDAEIVAAIEEWGETIRSETRAASLEKSGTATDAKRVKVGDAAVAVRIETDGL